MRQHEWTPKNGTAPIEPLCVDMRGLANLIGVGLRAVERMHANRELPAPVLIGKRHRWMIADVRSWLEAKRDNWAQWSTHAPNDTGKNGENCGCRGEPGQITGH